MRPRSVPHTHAASTGAARAWPAAVIAGEDLAVAIEVRDVGKLRVEPMIALLRGQLLEKHPSRLIVDVHGVGYDQPSL